jgi:hypothetical protein
LESGFLEVLDSVRGCGGNSLIAQGWGMPHPRAAARAKEVVIGLIG